MEGLSSNITTGNDGKTFIDTAQEIIMEFDYGGAFILIGLIVGLFIIFLLVSGFCCCGIMSCSCAACCHSCIGNVRRGSLFSKLQRCGTQICSLLMMSILFILIGLLIRYYFPHENGFKLESLIFDLIPFKNVVMRNQTMEQQ